MPTRSAAKAHRQSLKRRLRNRTVRRATKTAVNKAGVAIAGGDFDEARQAVRQAISILDRAGKKGVFHPNNVARRKSRLLLKFNAAVAALQPSPSEPTAKEEEVPKKKRTARARTKKAETKKAEK